MRPIRVHFIYICEGIEENRDCSGRGILLKSTETATYSWVLADALASSASRSSTYSSSFVNLPEILLVLSIWRQELGGNNKDCDLNELH